MKKIRGQDCVRRSQAADHRRALLHVEHVTAEMIFCCKHKFHELCFETGCEWKVVRRNLVGYTVVLMPIYE